MIISTIKRYTQKFPSSVLVSATDSLVTMLRPPSEQMRALLSTHNLPWELGINNKRIIIGLQDSEVHVCVKEKPRLKTYLYIYIT